VSRLLVAQRALTVPGWAKDALWRRAQAVPSLDLRFADNKSLVDAVTGASLVTFTRASSGTFVDSAGVLQTAATDVPRFDHDPTTGESLGPLVEGQRTNLVQQSADISNVYWVKSETTVTANAIAAPDGTMTAGKLVESTANSQHTLASAAITWVGNTQYTVTFYAKAGERFNFDLLLGTAGNWVNAERVATFNVSAGTLLLTPNSPAIASIQAVGNEWYRCRLTATTVASPSASAVFIRMADSTGLSSYQGITGNGIYLWGAQLEAGAFPTSYIPTTTATATRSADVADLISQAIANNIRTLYLEFRSPASGTRGVASLNDNTANERVNVLTSGTDPRLIVFDGGAEQANVNGGTVTANQRTRVAVQINANDFAISINGAAVVTDTSGTLPTVDRLMLGRTQAGEYLTGTLARVIGWDTTRPDLQTLSQ